MSDKEIKDKSGDSAQRWPDDRLDRIQIADFLTNYVTKRYSVNRGQGNPDSFVLGLSAEWGLGKTFFLSRWSKDLENNGHPVVYFDAWSNDFTEDPFTGLMAEIEYALSARFQSIPAARRGLDKAINIGRKLVKPAARILTAAIVKKLAGLSIEEFRSLLEFDETAGDDESNESEQSDEKSESILAKCGDIALKEHISRKESISIFKKKLALLVSSLEKESGVQLPIFILVDELDRCRPSYAIELLEAIKHIFGVPGIYFVIGTNVKQLAHSVRALYGNSFDAERYLKRFYDQEYILPAPQQPKFTQFLFERHNLNTDQACYAPIDNGLYPNTTPSEVIFSATATTFNLSLRDQEQVATTLQAILLDWPTGERLHFCYLLFLVVIKHLDADVFRRVVDSDIVGANTVQQVVDDLVHKNTLVTVGISRSTGMFESPGFPNTDIIKCTVLSIFMQYHTAKDFSPTELQKRISNMYSFPDKLFKALLDDMPQSYPTNSPPSSKLLSYPQRVSQAGQLKASI